MKQYLILLIAFCLLAGFASAAPVADFHADDTTPDVGQTVIFTDDSTDGAQTITTWAWTIEGVEDTDYQYVDATTSASQNPHVEFLIAGTYDVSLTATNDIAESDTEAKNSYITASDVTPAPVADFHADDTTPTVGQTVIFTDDSTNTPTSWAWIISGAENTDYQYVDATTSTSQNPHVEFLSAGTYDVSLTATNDGGSDTEAKISYITASAEAPVADFSADDTTPAVGQTVTFSDESTGATSWSWAFGDGDTSTAQNPTHQYDSVGTYDVSLTATGPGGSDTETKTDYITVSEAPPVASFTTDTPAGDYPAFLVKCTDTSTNSSPISWQWRFTHVTGNNTPVLFSTIQNPYIIFSDDGQYTIRLTVTNAEGSDQSDAASFTINDCTGDMCHRRFYSVFDGSVRNTTAGTWSGMRNAAAGTGTWENDGYNPSQVVASTTSGVYSNMYKSLATFDTSIIPYDATVQTVTANYWGYWKNDALCSFDISLIDANPANPEAYAAADWSRTSYIREADDITYDNWAETGLNTFSGVNTTYIHKGGTTVFGLALSRIVDDQEPAWITGEGANIFTCSEAADAESGCYGNHPYLEIGYDTTHVVSPPVASYTVIRPDRMIPDMRLTFTDTSTNEPTSWVWTATQVSGNNTPFTFSTAEEATITLGAGNWLIQHTATNDDGSDTTAPVFFNLTECTGVTCTHRYYPSNYATIGNTTVSTWADKYSAPNANQLWEPGTVWYLPVAMPSSHPEGIYGHWSRALLTFPTSALQDTIRVTRAEVKMWGAHKSNTFTSPNAAIVDADPVDPAAYAAGDWNRTTFTRLSADVPYADVNITPGEVNFVLNNNSYVNRAGNTSFYFTNNYIVDNEEPTPWVDDSYAYIFYCDAAATSPGVCKGLYNALEVSYLSNALPVVTSVTPASGVRGRLSAVTTINGRNFGPGSRVYLNKTGYPRIAATNVTIVSSTRITCTFPIPVGAPLGYRNVDVRNYYGRTGTRVNAYMVKAPVAPTVNSVTPATGTRGAFVTLSNVSGTGFISGAKVYLMKTGSTTITATNVTVLSARQIRCTVRIPPAATIGRWNLRVTNADNQSGARANAFMVRTTVPPTVSSVIPATGTQGTLVTITNLAGTGFVTGAKVELMRTGVPTITATNVVVLSPTRIRCTVSIPADAYIGSRDVRVTNADNQFGTAANAFTVARA